MRTTPHQIKDLRQQEMKQERTRRQLDANSRHTISPLLEFLAEMLGSFERVLQQTQNQARDTIYAVKSMLLTKMP